MKQGRDLRQSGLVYTDSAAVRAAKNGGVLVLDGIERVSPSLRVFEGRAHGAEGLLRRADVVGCDPHAHSVNEECYRFSTTCWRTARLLVWFSAMASPAKADFDASPRRQNLEDGTHIVSADRYDKMLRAGEDTTLFIPASRDFRVVALGVPVRTFALSPTSFRTLQS